MNGLVLGIIIIVVTAIAITVVNMHYTEKTLEDMADTYGAVLEKRDCELLDVMRDREFLSRRCAELEAKLNSARYNKPQEEFLDVPTAKKDYKGIKVDF